MKYVSKWNYLSSVKIILVAKSYGLFSKIVVAYHAYAT
jgi:hypothetical protein